MDHEKHLDLTYEATASAARELRTRLEEWLRAAGATAELVGDLVLATYEALANAVEHAYRDDHHHAVVRLRAQLTADEVQVIVSDRGAWASPGEAGHRGRGIPMMRYLADARVDGTCEGTTVQLRAPLHSTNHQ